MFVQWALVWTHSQTLNPQEDRVKDEISRVSDKPYTCGSKCFKTKTSGLSQNRTENIQLKCTLEQVAQGSGCITTPGDI